MLPALPFEAIFRCLDHQGLEMLYETDKSRTSPLASYTLVIYYPATNDFSHKSKICIAHTESSSL